MKKAENIEIIRTVRAIAITLDETVAFYETYVPTGQDRALIDQVNQSGFHPAFNVISDALHREVILGLCRIWDTRQDTANLNRLAEQLRDQRVISDLKEAGRVVDPSILQGWLADVDAGSKSDELLALRRARHRALAHTATPNQPYQGTARVVIYGDERKMLERTIPLVEGVGKLIGYSYVMPFADQRRERKHLADQLWSRFKN